MAARRSSPRRSHRKSHRKSSAKRSGRKMNAYAKFVKKHYAAAKRASGKGAKSTTVFKKGKAKGAQADLKAGMRVVVVTAGETESKAKEIQYAAAATTQQ